MPLNDNQWSELSRTAPIYPPITTHWHYHNIGKPEKKTSMSINDKIREERKEKRERERVESMWLSYDTNEFDALPDDAVIAFKWSPKDSEKEYSYAAIYTNGKWYCSGDLAPKGADPDTFIAWLIDKDVNIGDIEFLRGG